VKGDTTIF